jgi:hypothetical protein
MQEVVIDKFGGCLPRFGFHVPHGYAAFPISEYEPNNIDTSTGILRGHPDAEALSETIYGTVSGAIGLGFSKAQGQFMATQGHYSCEWRIDDYNLFFYENTSNVMAKRVGDFNTGAEAALGQTRLTNPPTTTDNAVGTMEAGTYQYFVTTLRNLGSHLDESGPSAVSTALTIAANREIRVTRPTVTDTDVTHWKIYRISDSSGEYQFVAQVAIGTTIYDDNNTDDDLSGSCPSWFTSKHGTSIIFDEFPFTSGTFEVSDDIYNGMLFAYSGTTLRWCEPGLPDAWPENYELNFPYTIHYATPFEGSLILITNYGCFRVDGTDPEFLQLNDIPGDDKIWDDGNRPFYPCRSSRGVLFYSNNGIILVTKDGQKNLTRDYIQHTFLQSKSGAICYPQSKNALYEINGYIFYMTSWFNMDDNSVGVCNTVLDMNQSPPSIFTLNTLSVGACPWKSGLSGDFGMVGLTGGVQKMATGQNETEGWTWYSGYIPYNIPGIKDYKEVEFFGSGTVTVMLSVDHSAMLVSRATLDFTTKRGRTLKFPEGSVGNNMHLDLAGSNGAYIEKMIIRYESQDL